MSRKGMSFAMKQQIEDLLSRKVPIRKIAIALKVSRNTIRRVIKECGIVAQQSVVPPRPTRDWLLALPFEDIIAKRQAGRPLNILFSEHEPGVSYSSFCRAINSLCVKPPSVTVRLTHQPGEKTFVDYCDGLLITDRGTGETTKTQFFCGVLPFSSLTFGEFTLDQKLESFITSHDRMWAYFGGVTPYVVVDNLKSGVLRAHIYDPEVNPTYCDFGQCRAK